MSELLSPAVPESSSKGYFSNSNNDRVIDSDLLYQHNNTLAIVCGRFFVYLLVPKGVKKPFCTANPQRFVNSGASSISTTKDRVSHIWEILPIAKHTFFNTIWIWKGEKSLMSTTPSKVISHGTSSYEYRQVCCTASHLLFQTDNHHCGGKDTNSWKLSNTCSSLHSFPARLFSTEKLPLNYGSMNDRDVQSFPLT